MALPRWSSLAPDPKAWGCWGRVLCWALLFTQLPGCAGSDMATDTLSGLDHGGQTGSLIPDLCSGEAEEPSQVVTGDVAFASSQQVHSATLADSTGQEIAVTAESMGEEGATVLRTEMALTQGQYLLIAECPMGSVAHVLQVGEAAPLPEALGTLTLSEHAERCDQSRTLGFELELEPKAVPYSALLELSVQFDSGPEWVWVPYGTLPQPAADEPLVLPLKRCSGEKAAPGCAPRSNATLHVTARIAGEAEALPAIDVPFDGRCTVQKHEPAAGCEVTPRAKVLSTPARGQWLLLSMSALGALCVRRRRTRSAPLANRS